MVVIVGCRPVCEDIEPVALPGNNMPAPPAPSGEGGIPDFSEEVAYTYPMVVVYNGTIYRADGPTGPGPFNPDDWTQLDGTEGGQAIVTEDSPTVSFEGDGTEENPLTASIDRTGLIQWARGTVWYVDAVNGADANVDFDGSAAAPFATIAFALSQASISDVIQLAPGTYEESIDFISEVTIQGFGVQDANQVKLHGSFSIGDGVTGVRLKDLQLVGASGAPTLFLQNSGGKHKFDNVTIAHDDGPSATAIELIGDNTEWFHIDGGSISGIVTITDGNISAPFNFIIERGSEPFHTDLAAPSVQLTISDHLRLGSIVHAGGVLLLKDIGYIVKDSGGNGVISSANAGQGALFMTSVALMQADGSFAALQKSGTAPFMLLGVKSDPLGADLAGTNLLGENAKYMNAQYQPENYFPLSQSIYHHLQGIDEALAFACDGRTVVHEIVLSRSGPLLDQQVVLDYIATKQIELPANLVNTKTFFRADPGQSVSLTLLLNDAVIGQIDIDTTSVNIDFPDAHTIEVDDIFTVRANGDAAFSNVAVTLQGLRQLDYVA